MTLADKPNAEVKPVVLETLAQHFTVCKLQHAAQADFTGAFVFLSKTDAEISLICETGRVPEGALAAEPGWRALRVAGALDFALVGVISKISGLLAEAGIPVFVVSTYDTDYVFVKADRLAAANHTLTKNGYIIA